MAGPLTRWTGWCAAMATFSLPIDAAGASDRSSGGDFFARTLAGDLTLQHSIRTRGSNIVPVAAGVSNNCAGGALLPGSGGTWQMPTQPWEH
jgi:hypothetical protein